MILVLTPCLTPLRIRSGIPVPYLMKCHGRGEPCSAPPERLSAEQGLAHYY